MFTTYCQHVDTVPPNNTLYAGTKKKKKKKSVQEGDSTLSDQDGAVTSYADSANPFKNKATSCKNTVPPYKKYLLGNTFSCSPHTVNTLTPFHQTTRCALEHKKKRTRRRLHAERSRWCSDVEEGDSTLSDQDGAVTSYADSANPTSKKETPR